MIISFFLLKIPKDRKTSTRCFIETLMLPIGRNENMTFSLYYELGHTSSVISIHASLAFSGADASLTWVPWFVWLHFSSTAQ